MERETAQELCRFLSAQKVLAQLGVIRSRDYIGDIAKYLCAVVYGFECRESRRPAGYDGMIGTSRVRVQVNNCPTGTKVRVSEPFEFDELIVVLGPNSSLRPDGDIPEEFVFYRLSRKEFEARFTTPGGHYIGGKKTFSQGYDRVLGLSPAAL